MAAQSDYDSSTTASLGAPGRWKHYKERISMSDGWRGTKLGYAGGRTGWLAQIDNDSLRGTRGVGYTFNNMRVARDTTTMLVTATALIGGIYVLQGYRGRNKLVKAVKKATKPVTDTVNRGVSAITG